MDDAKRKFKQQKTKAKKGHRMIKFASRLDLPEICNARGLLGTAAEVGVHVGSFALHFRSRWKGRLYIGVDPYTVYPGARSDQATHDEYLRHATVALQPFIANGTAKLLRMTGLRATQEPLGLVDFVYLDGDHAYAAVKPEIEAWWPLVRSGGILAGHDYVPDGFHQDGNPYIGYATREEALVHGPNVNEFGVKRAVHEFFEQRGIEISISDPLGVDHDYLSWAVVKP